MCPAIVWRPVQGTFQRIQLLIIQFDALAEQFCFTVTKIEEKLVGAVDTVLAHPHMLQLI